MTTNKKIDISMVTWNRPEFTKRSIDAINKNTNYPYRIMVVDNGSKKKTRELLWQMYTDRKIHLLVLLEKNYGLEYAKNIGLDSVESKYHISTDNDILPQKGWLGKLVKLMDENPEYAAISCRTQVMIGTGNIYDGKENQDIVEFPHPGGSLRIMRTKLVKKVGGWRNDEPSRGSEEKYICGKLRELGYKTGFAVKVKCYHMFGKGNWGYDKKLKPEQHGHNPVWHPAIQNGDDPEELKKYE
jgi:O-antigen biosynthesis protein